jgi:NADPH-dependent ferric siderophore reductase
MSSAKGRIVRLFSGVLRRAVVASVRDIGGFRRVLLRCDVPRFSAGAKVQLLLPSDDMRTYTPIRAPDGVTLRGWTHAGGPGARWLAGVQAGEELPFVGPQRSLGLDAGPVVLVAAAFAVERSTAVHAVIQSDAAAGFREAAASVGLAGVVVVARGDTAASVEAVSAARSTSPGAVVGLTGGSELVVAVRDALRRAGVRNIKTKAYWIPGKTGLD